MTTKQLSITISYILAASLTYGYAYNDEWKEQSEMFPGYKASNIGKAQMVGLFCAATWPIYWPFHISRLMWSK